MRVLIFGPALFALAFIVHLVVWRIRLPVRQTKVLLEIFLAIMVAGLVVLWNFPSAFTFLGRGDAPALSELIRIFLLYSSLTLAYMITYSAIEVDSPSLIMVMRIAKAGSRGLGKEDFDRQMSDDLLIKPRIDDLIVDKMVYLEGEKFKLTNKGTLMARIFIFYRYLLKAPKGG